MLSHSATWVSVVWLAFQDSFTCGKRNFCKNSVKFSNILSMIEDAQQIASLAFTKIIFLFLYST